MFVELPKMLRDTVCLPHDFEQLQVEASRCCTAFLFMVLGCRALASSIAA